MDQTPAFQLQVPNVKIVFGPGSLKKAGQEAGRLGKQRALVVCGRSIAHSTPALEILEESLGSRYAGAFTGAVYALNQRAPARDLLVQKIIETRADLIISVGGGIAIATARNGRTAYLRQSPADHDLPMMCVPTTLSAAEANVAYVPTPTPTGRGPSEASPERSSPQANVVEGPTRRVPEPGSRPLVAILDPELAAHTPTELFCSSGFNAISHCIEGMCSTAHHPFADGIYLKALSLLVDSLPNAQDPKNVDARGQALLGGYTSGLMMESTWLGIAHALCHGLQSVFGTPHGLHNTVMITQGMRYNLDVAADRIAATTPALGLLPGPDALDAPHTIETAQRCISAVEGLRRRMGLPDRLRDIPGIDPQGFPQAADIALHDFFTPYNPRQPQGVEELLEIYRKAW